MLKLVAILCSIAGAQDYGLRPSTLETKTLYIKPMTLGSDASSTTTGLKITLHLGDTWIKFRVRNVYDVSNVNDVEKTNFQAEVRVERNF